MRKSSTALALMSLALCHHQHEYLKDTKIRIMKNNTTQKIENIIEMKLIALSRSLPVQRRVLLKSVIAFVFLILLGPLASAQDNADHSIIKGNVGGFTNAQKEKVDQTYNAGYTMYVAAWPLLREYPGPCFLTQQTSKVRLPSLPHIFGLV